MAHWARRRRIQIIHCNEHDVYPFGILLRWLLGIPIVCHVRFRIAREFCTWAFAGNGKQPDAILWTSRQQREDCATAFEGLVPETKQHLVYLGLDLEDFGTLAGKREEVRRSWGIQSGDIVIGTASALRPIKRIHEFIDLVSSLARKDPRIVGVIAGDAVAGDESYREKILRQIKDSGLGQRLQWLGRLEPVEPFYHAIDIFVSTCEYETFGNSVCEAMACRRPVVAYRGGSVHEVVGETGLIVPTGDLQGLRESVAKVVECPELRSELGDRGYRRVADHFNPAISLKQLKGIYQSLLGQKPDSVMPEPTATHDFA
jgi:glycosyltransferase involved in cell wall biosynthesis